MQVNGIGTTLLGVSTQDDDNVATATKWFTFLYLPVWPLARWRVQFLPHTGPGFSYRPLSREPLSAAEIVRTYLLGWVAAPLALLGPFSLAVKEVWEAVGLPAAGHLPYLALCCLWFAFAVWGLRSRHEARCRPKSMAR
jgi:hypothetical protein